ncbi:hypothetical protein QO179_23480 [Bacillus stercoris]|nr:hypothetical protein [Bacillus stercoris]
MTNEDDNSVEWGDYVLQRVEMWKEYFEVPYDLDLIITGEESVRRNWFRKDAVKNINQLVLSRDQVPISATAMRKYLATDDLESWIKWMPVSPEGNSRMSIDEAKNLYNELREELSRIPDYQIKGSVDV